MWVKCGPPHAFEVGLCWKVAVLIQQCTISGSHATENLEGNYKPTKAKIFANFIEKVHLLVN